MKIKGMVWNTRFRNTAFWNIMRYLKRWSADVVPLVMQNTVSERSLLIVRLDAIGDYVLFRNFIKTLKESKRFKQYRISLCGNEIYKELAETLDGPYIDQFVWINKHLFWNDLGYRFKKMRLINKHGYDVVLNPVYSREALYGDAIVRVVSANEKIGLVGDSMLNPAWLKKIADRWYTKLLPSDSSIHFEFCRTKEFFETIQGETLPIQKPSIDTAISSDRYVFREPYAVICPGSSTHALRWNISHFLKVAEYLSIKYKITSVLVGTAAEQLGQNILKEIESLPYIKNVIGCTSLMDTVSIIKKTALVVSNETSIAHMGVAMDKPVVVISNGNHYGRFTEYPAAIYDKIRYAYAAGVFQSASTFDERAEYFKISSNIDINTVSVQQVIGLIDTLLN